MYKKMAGENSTFNFVEKDMDMRIQNKLSIQRRSSKKFLKSIDNVMTSAQLRIDNPGVNIATIYLQKFGGIGYRYCY